jgi:hypothetical protein
MKKLNSLHAVLCMVFVVACLNTSAFGQSVEDRNRIATIGGGGSSVRWDVSMPYAELTMTVSAPDGRVFRKEFNGSTSPQFTLVDDKGERLPDGQYNYELRLTPIFSPGVTEELAAARARENAPEPVVDKSKKGTMSESLVQQNDAADTVREMQRRGLLPTEPLVKSGAFTILNGSAIVNGRVEEAEPRPATRMTEVSRLSSVPLAVPVVRVKQHHLLMNAFPDQVIPDDLIVQGSACIGLDCVNNESFGFDTIRLKENNTRIKFDDTSTSAGFPANDWQLTANDSASGGQSKFSIEDITGAKVPFTVEAGSATNSIYVDSTARVGFRTSTPVLDIHVNTSNTPAIRLEQNSSGGFTAQTWDVAGNEANFFVRDVTGGSRLPFRVRPGAPTSSIDINASGRVGIGTASPSFKLDVATDGLESGARVFGTGGVRFDLHSTNADAGSRNWAARIDNTTFGDFAIFQSNAKGGDPFTAGTARLYIKNTGEVGIGTTAPTLALSVSGDANKSAGGGSWQVFSDERLKNIKGNFNSGLRAVMQLQPLRYEYKRDNALGLKSGGEQIGFGAHALQKVIPEAVTQNITGYLQVNNDPIIWTMLNAIKEQQKEIEQLKGQIQKLRARSHRQR